eukprot:57091-Eustigmatos_ZCMA.PRE.1
MEQNLGLDPQWLEIVRRLLMDNTTRLCGVVLSITIGAFQGSPLSPLFCLIYMDDLARDLLNFFKERAFKAPLSFPQVPGLDEHQLLVVLLLFADDILALGLTPGDLQLVVERIAQWATRRGIKLSPKSFAAVLAGSGE